MTDKAERAELEATQVQLRTARERLAQPLEGLRAEAEAELQQLARQHHDLTGTVAKLRSAVDSARLRLINMRTDRVPTLKRQLGTASLTLLFCVTLVAGAIGGFLLEKNHCPTWLAWVACAGAAALGFNDLTSFVRWLKK